MLPLFALAAATAPTHLRPQGQMQKTIRRIGMMRQERPRATPATQGKEEVRDVLWLKEPKGGERGDGGGKAETPGYSQLLPCVGRPESDVQHVY